MTHLQSATGKQPYQEVAVRFRKGAPTISIIWSRLALSIRPVSRINVWTPEIGSGQFAAPALSFCMFEKALIRGAGNENKVDIGLVAETLLFYQSSHLLLDMGSLPALINQLGADGLLSLLQRPGVTASYCPEIVAVHNDSKNGLVEHDFGQLFWSGTQANLTAREQIRLCFKRNGSVSQRTLSRINQLISITNLPTGTWSIPKATRADCEDSHFLTMAARSFLQSRFPNFDIPSNMKFSLIRMGDAFVVDTNIDFTKLNRGVVEGFHLSAATILSHLIDARADTHFAADYMAELVTGPVNSAIIRLKHFDFVRRRMKSEEQHDMFESIVLSEARTVREVVNAKERSIDDLFRLIDEGSKFRSWMHSQNPDSELVREYYDRVNKETWIGRLPGKSIRFAFFSGAGIIADMFAPTGIGTATGLGLGATDSLLLDKLLRGWRPSHFIEGPLKSFVRDASGSADC